jgi:hypothetical protein
MKRVFLNRQKSGSILPSLKDPPYSAFADTFGPIF